MRSHQQRHLTEAGLVSTKAIVVEISSSASEHDTQSVSVLRHWKPYQLATFAGSHKLGSDHCIYLAVVLLFLVIVELCKAEEALCIGRRYLRLW